MFQAEGYTGNKQENYELLVKQLDALVDGEPNVLANLSNAAALLNQFLTEVNWVGFYLYDKEQAVLTLGPFQGLPACTRIPAGRGVCGTAVSERRTMRVADVHAFPGHIACDAASRSEIVIPIFKEEEIYGVLDIDSPITDRFDELDEKYLKEFVLRVAKCV
ncbi:MULTISPECIES: GAF domain-containing protein [Brevibacillus]|uniref:GAF domain-containing protein n=1 Tax=Brevibacillus TaxID=55080 RepID=UPI000CE51B8D|nr:MULTISPECIES: GAF domain-containing protein [Brevibacillus]AYB38303.1 GAF domain-containing protein [Brevibacillus laterosporus]MBM7111889.1 Free methionine-R-sulfoxide reductase [Brevibacillus laterosporus]MCG7318629.1 GAF domain-containing protein [Brevibacillus laterosporus]NKQ18665.1 GAF domain-containing protein [Brevibacillus laterosporus]PPA86133.1 histidine kinase [Brevibacillus laterosporus]